MPSLLRKRSCENTRRGNGCCETTAGMRHYTSQEGTMPATVQLSGNPDIDGLLWGYKWVSVFPSLQMTSSFPASANEYAGYDAVNGFEAFNNAQKTAVTNIPANIDHVCRITFTLTTGANATLRFAEASSLDYGGIDPPPLKWSALRYGFLAKEDHDAEEETQARGDRCEAAPGGCAGVAGAERCRGGTLDWGYGGHVLPLAPGVWRAQERSGQATEGSRD